MDEFPFKNMAALNTVIEAQLRVWPEHRSFLVKSFSHLTAEALQDAEDIARTINILSDGSLSDLCRDYQWTCDRLREEELNFGRTGHYRITTFEEAEREVYSRPDFMAKYLNGLLLSQLFWANHRNAFSCFLHHFLADLPRDYSILEVGPGHGLYISRALTDPRCSRAVAWDVSETALRDTSDALSKLGTRPADTHIKNILTLSDADRSEHFDAIIVSEVLEHLETPGTAAANLRECLKSGGSIFINVPINSPAPDHIFLLRAPEEAVDLIESCGIKIVARWVFPATGYSEERARRHRTTLSCVVVGTRD